MQSVSVITLAVGDLARSATFYRDGFGWEPIFDGGEILFYQMNGFVLGLWSAAALADDAGLAGLSPPGGCALAHNVAARALVDEVVARLERAGGTITRPPDAPPHGGYRGYVRDPDGHLWEIAFNPDWIMDAEGFTRFAGAGG